MSKIVYVGAMDPRNLECLREDDFARMYKALRAGPDAPDYMVNHAGAASKDHLEKLRNAFTAAGFAVTDPGLPGTALAVSVPATDAGTDACRMNWFREKHARFRKLAESTDLKTFACDAGVVLDMKTALSDDRGDAVWLWTGCGPRLYPLDELVRKLPVYYTMDRAGNQTRFDRKNGFGDEIPPVRAERTLGSFLVMRTRRQDPASVWLRTPGNFA